MDRKQIRNLLYRYRHGLSNESERRVVESWYSEIESREIHELSDSDISESENRMRERIVQHITLSRRSKTKIYRMIAFGASVAASILLFFLWPNSSPETAPVIFAGKESAFLDLGNGKRMDLSQMSIGQELEDSGVHIHKTRAGEIYYELTNKSGIAKQNILTVPKGASFTVVLPDGSKVWLNADSELSYPSTFSDNQRDVQLKGEAFFDISHDKRRPFTVNTLRAMIQVLGTKFNVQAYPNELFWNATVEDGRVNVFNDTKSVILNKGDQATINLKGLIERTPSSTANSSWRDGNFHFSGTDINTIARQVERWYNIPVEVDPRLKKLEFYGIIPRQESANQLFEILQETHTIKTTITKDKIVIQPTAN